jgi:hypothetical protein
MIKNVVREIRDVIYGDLKNRILRLERAIYEQNTDNILVEIRDIIREIWGT